MRRTISRHEQIRRARGFTVTRLAREFGVFHSYVSLVEGGLEKPSPRYRKAASAILGVPQDLIFDVEVVSESEEGLKRLGETDAFAAEVERLAERAPEPPRARRRRRERRVSRRKPPPLAFSDAEAAQLRRLVDQAFDLRETPYLREACEAVVDFHERTLPDRLERQAKAA